MNTMTLLQIVNSVQNSMDSEKVTTISETEESEQVLQIIRDVYEAFITKEDWPHLKTVTQLVGLADATRPNFMQMPAAVSEVYSLKYRTTQTGDTDEEWTLMQFMEPADFIEYVQARNTSNTNVVTFNTAESIPLYIINDQMPTYYTSFDDEILIFDSYDAVEDTTMIASKSLIEVLRSPTWVETDAAVPDLPGKMFPTFLARCKEVANEDLAQRSKRHAREDYREGKSTMRRKARRAEPRVKRINYGRK